MAKLNMVQAINLALDQQMAKDDTVMIIGEDVGLDEGVFRVTAGHNGGSDRYGCCWFEAGRRTAVFRILLPYHASA